MEVQIVSRETIKPAAAYRRKSNNDQKIFQLSFMDVLSPECYIPITFFYSMNETNDHFNKEEITSRLKLSLSQTLARFPMLAGKIKGNFIHCSDEDDDIGALFVEAKVQITMAEFLKSPNLNLLAQFLPFPLLPNQPMERAVQVGVKVNFFTCGGIAIGLSLLHKVIDGTTKGAFIKSWAASSDGIFEQLVCGDYSSASSLFPLREISDGFRLLSPETPFVVAQGRSSTTRRFVFDAMTLSNLKAKAKSPRVPNPTSVEVVTCFIWKYAMKAASRCKSFAKKEVVGTDQGPTFVHSEWQSVLVHTVNMRKRIQPPLSENNVGNLFWRSCACFKTASNTDTDTELVDLESIVRESLSEINNNFIQQAIGDNGFETLSNSLQRLHELYAKSSESYLFTSWRNNGFNEVNFGWGKPVWVAGGGKVFDSIVRNLIILMETPAGDGIEAWVVLDDETMNLLEKDDEFLEFASPNPSIITLDGI